MIVKSASDFKTYLDRSLPLAQAPAVPRGVFLVDPVEFFVSEETARDNVYMDTEASVNQDRALRQVRQLAEALNNLGVPVVRFPGSPDTPDAVFPNNVFATIPDRFIVGAMLYPGRQKEAERKDIRNFFTRLMGYELVDLSEQTCVAELTGALILDRARSLGFCGMTQRVDEAGAYAMHQAFDLKLTLQFDLKPDEYHTNVVMSVLASRAVVMQPDAFVDQDVPPAIEHAFPGRTLYLDTAEKEAFAGNCIALTESDLFMSETAADGLRSASRATLEGWGFTIHAVPVDELEKAGGSLRCMVAEIF